MLAIMTTLAGCSGSSSGAPGAAAATGPVDDPCALVTDSEVRAIFPDARSGKRDHRLDQYKIASCMWDAPTGTLIAQIFEAKGLVIDELRNRVSASVDPIKPGAGKDIRYEKVEGVGDDTMLAAEKADDAQGILADTAVIVTKHGTRLGVLFSNALVNGDRAATVKALQSLGRSAASRL